MVARTYNPNTQEEQVSETTKDYTLGNSISKS